MDRRGFLRQGSGVVAGVAWSGLVPVSAAQALAGGAGLTPLLGPDAVLNQKYPFTLPPLPYANNAVAPAVDARTMAIHHDRHHAAFVTSLNAALASQSALHQYTLGELLMGLRRWPAAVQAAIRLHGGGHANHALLWNLLTPGGPAAPTGMLAEMIARDFESVAALTAALKSAAMGQVGNGWAWLVKTATSRLAVRALPNEDSPLLEGELPVVGIDVWDHAYALTSRHRRADYVDALLARLNWDVADAQVT